MASVGKGSKTKGASYERKTAKALTLWWGFEFHRTPASGGLRWAEDNNVAGDIVTPPQANFPFVVECKHQEGDWTLESVVLNTLNIRHWWSQVVSDSRRVHRVPLLLFTRNRAKDFVMMPYDDEIYNELVATKHEVMRTVVTTTDELTKKDESFDVMVFLFDGLTSFQPLRLISKYETYDWEAESLIRFPKEQVEEEQKSAEEMANDVMKKLKP